MASVVGAVVVWWLLVGSVNRVTEEMEFSDFTMVEVEHAFEVKITQSSARMHAYRVDPSHLFLKLTKFGKNLRGAQTKKRDF